MGITRTLSIRLNVGLIVAKLVINGYIKFIRMLRGDIKMGISLAIGLAFIVVMFVLAQWEEEHHD